MKRAALLFCCLLPVLLSACGEGESDVTGQSATALIPSLTWMEPEQLDAATEFTFTRSEDGYTLVSIPDDGASYLVIPKGQAVPENLPDTVTPLCQPLSNVYLAASATMDMVVKLGALDAVAFSSLPAGDWTIPEAKAAMEEGMIEYAGKYSAPDYERICSGDCPLAIENTMLYHSPEIREQLERFGVPVLVDHASHEATPLGRMEWIKLYGVLFGKEAQAEAVYEAQAETIRDLEGTDAGKRAAFFYLSSNGEVKVRRPDDYIPQLIRMAGGEYVFDSLEETSALSTVTLQWEDFYAQARDADVLIYNSTVTEVLPDLEALTAKNPLLSDFAAVQSGEVYCTRENFYQASMELGDLAGDLHRVLTGEKDDLTFLTHLE